MSPRPRLPSPRFDFRGGVNTSFSEDVLDTTELRLAQNGRSVQGGYAKVLGSKRIHATALASGAQVTGLVQWEPASGAQVVAIAGGQLFTWHEGDADFTAGPTGFSLTNAARFATYRTGSTIKLLIADGTLWSWDGTTRTNLTTGGAPAAIDVALYKLRAVAIDVTKTLYGSKVGDVTLWAPADGGFTADIETFDTEPLTGLMVVGSSLILPKAENIARFTGIDANDVQIDTQTEGISNSVGVISPRTLIQVDGPAPGSSGAFAVSAIGPIFIDEAGVAELGIKIADQFAGEDRTAWAAGLAVRYQERREIWVWLPSGNAWIYSEEQQNWSGPITGKPATAVCPFISDDGTETFLRAGADGFVRREQIAASALEDVLSDGTGGTAITCLLKTPPLLFGAPGVIKKLWDAQSLEADLGDSGSLEVGWLSELGNGSTVVSTFGAGLRDYAFRLGAAGRRITMTFTEATANPIQLNGFTPVAMLSSTQAPRGIGPIAVPKTVLVSPDSFRIAIGSTVQLVSQVLDQFGRPMSGQAIVWTSSDDSIADVDGSGLASGDASGSCTITASVGTVSGSCAASVAVPEIALTPGSASLPTGGEATLAVAFSDGLGNPIAGATVALASSDPSHVAVPATVVTDGAGAATFVATAVGAGSANVTASADGVTSAAAVIAVAAASGLTLRTNQVSFALRVGATWQASIRTADVFLNAVAAPAITYDTSDHSVATVDAAGLVTALAPGSVTLIASSTAGTIRVRGRVTSNVYVMRDRFQRADSNVSAGVAETGQVWTPQGTSVAGIKSDLLYFPTPATDQPAVVDVGSKDGVFAFQLAAPSQGWAVYLRYTDSSNYMKVWSQGGTISVNGKSAGATTGLTFWTATLQPDDLLIVRLSGSITQVQVNNDIIGSFTLAALGALTGTKIGVGFETTRGAAFGRFGEVTAQLLDHAPSTTVASMELTQSSAVITADGMLLLRAAQILATGENVSRGRNTSNSGPLAAAIAWSSDNEAVATVSASGVISGVGAGSCTITASDGTFSAACALTVTAAAGFSVGLDYANEPDGFVQRTDRDFSIFNPAGNPDPWTAGEPVSSNMAIVSDPTAPKSPNNVLQLQYPAQPSTQPVPAGATFSAGRIELDFATPHPTAVYLCRWIKLDPNFQGHPTGSGKLGEFFVNNGASAFAHPLTDVRCVGTAGPAVQTLCLNGGTDYREGQLFTPNLVPDAVQPRGVWTKLEYLVVLNTIAADGTPIFNAEYHVWLDGRKIIEMLNLKIGDIAGGAFTQWKPDYLWGGQGGTINATFYVWEDHHHVSSNV